jgi:hypothetical protein
MLDRFAIVVHFVTTIFVVRCMCMVYDINNGIVMDQVSRMLLGGMKVVGIYVWASDIAFKNSTMILCQAMKAVSDAIRHLDPSLNEALLIHICYSPRRWNCRTCLLSSSITSSNLRPCDFKLGKVLSSLQRFRCSYNFSFRYVIAFRFSLCSCFRSIQAHSSESSECSIYELFFLSFFVFIPDLILLIVFFTFTQVDYQFTVRVGQVHKRLLIPSVKNLQFMQRS